MVRQSLSVKQLKSIVENEHIPSFAYCRTVRHQGLIYVIRFIKRIYPHRATGGDFSLQSPFNRTDGVL